MRRFSLWRLMLLVALAAVTARTVTYVGKPGSAYDVANDVYVGSLPLNLALVLSTWFALRPPYPSWRIFLRPGRAFAVAFACACIPPAVGALDVRNDSRRWMAVIVAAGEPTFGFLRRRGLFEDLETTSGRYVVIPAFLWVVISGPPLLAASAIASIVAVPAWALQRRKDDPCADSRS